MVLELSCIFINTSKAILYFVIVSPCLVMVDKKQKESFCNMSSLSYLYCR